MLRIPHCLDNRLTDGGKVVSPTQVIQCEGQDGPLWHSCLYTVSLGVDISPFSETLNFLCERNGLISLIRLVENSIIDNLYSKPGCYNVSKAFPISKNTAAVDILLKLKVTWSVSLIH
jgi:hypothetical protein